MCKCVMTVGLVEFRCLAMKVFIVRTNQTTRIVFWHDAIFVSRLISCLHLDVLQQSGCIIKLDIIVDRKQLVCSVSVTMNAVTVYVYQLIQLSRSLFCSPMVFIREPSDHNYRHFQVVSSPVTDNNDFVT